MAHRLAWLLTHGEWPEHEIDHINGDRSDNRLVNLRPATRQQNMINRRMHKSNKLGVKGVTQVKDRYRAQLWFNGEFVLNRTFATIEEASAAYQAKAQEVFGEWNRAA
ncbi:HNH endonuclease signature motif containing protein [Caulobacter sp. UC70_42]|uniref:HNH endonuclease signature motif containing protein n=1 Tax=Caulobacter sp. UC70_42 TaxID=3374551 RepID=UPI0037571993